MIKSIWVALFAAIFFSGCTTKDPYRTKYDNLCEYKKSPDCACQVMHISNPGTDVEYRLSFIEYDDQGQLHTPNARRAITDAYRKIASEEEILLITFVHGWHHNANGDPEDENINSFREILKEASKNESKISALSGNPPRKVLGVYIGWRGRLLKGIFDYSTFWDRKATAQEVGYQGMTEFLLELEHITKQNKIKYPNNKMVTIGHSFGGAALFSSLHSVLSERYISSRPYKTTKAADGFGDLVVLLNPAFEAIRYGSLYDLSQDECRDYPETQLPKLVILSSHADLAVRWAFPTGRRLSSLLESHRKTHTLYCSKTGSEKYDLNQWYADIYAVGHFDPYVTHFLGADANSRSSISNGKIVNATQAWLSQIQSDKGEVKFNGAILTSKGRTKPLNPYMNIFTTEKVMKGHNDIWNKVVLSFVNDLISISTAE